jgi:aminoglycoside phosphotransferase (APT) family kinase protein
MLSGAPQAARWLRAEPRRSQHAQLVESILHTEFPHHRLLKFHPFNEGMRNANFRLRLDRAPHFAVLRIYEDDPSLCQKEIDLLRLLHKSDVAVQEILFAQPQLAGDLPPFTLTNFIEGTTFRELKRTGDPGAIAQAAHSAGEILAAIGRLTFPKSGWLEPGPSIGSPLLEGADAVPRLIDACLAEPNLQARVPDDFRDAIHALVWSFKSELAQLDKEAHLVHGDFGKTNILVRNVAGRWSVVGVLDWEFAISRSPLCDIGHFLRYERVARPLVEPYFSEGFTSAGGILPKNWRQLARVFDMIALCESLTHDHLPADVESELLELVRATTESRDPVL